MRITVESESALRIMLFLSLRGVDTKTGAKMISENENIPIRFSLKILRKLKLSGFIKSYRGQSGGYALINEPKDITLKSIIETIDGPIIMNKCLTDDGECNLNRSSVCPIHHYLYDVQREISAKLENINFQMLIDKYESSKGDITTYIKGLI